jgi:hypothetical protein
MIVAIFKIYIFTYIKYGEYIEIKRLAIDLFRALF